jgi:hypothetical protein
MMRHIGRPEAAPKGTAIKRTPSHSLVTLFAEPREPKAPRFQFAFAAFAALGPSFALSAKPSSNSFLCEGTQLPSLVFDDAAMVERDCRV